MRIPGRESPFSSVLPAKTETRRRRDAAISRGGLGKNHLALMVTVMMLAAAFISGCGTRQARGPDLTDPAMPDAVICADLAKLPQNLTVYAEKAGLNRVLISAEQQQREHERFLARFFEPWTLRQAGITARQAFWGMDSFRPEKGYIENLRPFPRERWDELAANSNIGAFPGPVRHAVTVRSTALRLMPTHTPYFRYPRLDGEGYPFDYFQNSALWAGVPVALTHSAQDGAWVFAQTREASGWLPVEHVALVDSAFMKQWREGPHAAVTADRVTLRPAADASGSLPAPVQVHIGAVLPLAPGPQPEQSLRVLYPVRGVDGRAETAAAEFSRDGIAVMPLPLTPGTIARVGNRMLNQPYGWGGLYEDRDCSSTTRDLFTPFGVWLPRNSAQQARWGRQLTVTGLAPDEKEERIMAEGVPFFSLVKLPGHVGLYLGSYELDGKKKPLMFHNIWGLRLLPGSEQGAGQAASAGRAVIGKAVVTSLRPGAELPAIASPASLLDRIEGLSILPEAGNGRLPDTAAAKPGDTPAKQ